MEMDFAAVTPKLGFGLMRLPKLSDAPTEIDIEQTSEMVDLFLEAGFTYFDTAYVYDGGGSEKAAKKALVDRHPRESYTLATKLNAWLGQPDLKTAENQINVSLERSGAGYFDYYLLHALQPNNRARYEEYRLWDYARKLKEEGKVKHWGFSFHGNPDMLEELLTEYPDAEFVQLQINYADWDIPTVAARGNYEVARKHGKQIVVMEPVKGGMLANPPEAIAKLFREKHPDWSNAAWAIKYAASHEGIITVLSGMSNLEQMRDNLAAMKDFQPLAADDLEVIAKAQKIINEADTIPCTGCHYCTDGCPMKIQIPGIFRAVNTMKIYNDKKSADARYGMATRGEENGNASSCIACGQCEGACPQQIEIIRHLQTAAEMFD